MAANAHITPRRREVSWSRAVAACSTVMLVGFAAGACSSGRPRVVTDPRTTAFTAGLPSTPGAAPSSSSVSPPAATVGTRSPILDLPLGQAVEGVPYAIGKRLFLNGSPHDFSPSWKQLTGQTSADEFSDLDVADGVVIWSIRLSAVDPLAVLGGFVPGQPPRSFAKVPNFPGIATTTDGYVAAGLSGVYGGAVDVYTPSGTTHAPSYVSKHSMPSQVISTSAGAHFVMADFDQVNRRYTSSLLDPGSAPVSLADNTFGAGRGTGWIATETRSGSACYRTAAVATPRALRAVLCSQRVPMVSDDGAKAVVVQGNRVVTVDAQSGSPLRASSAPALTGWDETHGYWLERWLDSDSYLVNVRDGPTLALLRCSVTDGSCDRVVTATVRTGVSRIVS